MNDIILVLNAGSSSLKFGLFEYVAQPGLPQKIASGVARPERDGNYQVKVVGGEACLLADETWPADTIDDLIPQLLRWIDRQINAKMLVAVGHRIVHGGSEYHEPVEIDDRVLSGLEALIPLAPLHQPACLAPVRLIRRLRPGLRQLACFDTAFHRSIGPPASRYGLPRQYEAEGIRRYGFHGLSFESIAAQIAAEDEAAARQSRIVIAHLGSGASLCALRELQSVDTTMGFSTLDGLVMGTRPGPIDPGILLFLLKGKRLSVDELELLLYRKSGLLGVSGISSDVETLLASSAPTARQALDLFAFQVARQTAALAATLGGLDRFIFTGGIGEHAAAVRSMIVDRLAVFGPRLDDDANSAGACTISSSDSKILIERRPTQEEEAIAKHVSTWIAVKSVDMPSSG